MRKGPNRDLHVPWSDVTCGLADTPATPEPDVRFLQPAARAAPAEADSSAACASPPAYSGEEPPPGHLSQKQLPDASEEVSL